jgi:hypothetical protein
MLGVEKKYLSRVLLLELATLVLGIAVIYIAYILSKNTSHIIFSFIVVSNACIIGAIDFIITRIVKRDIYYDNSIFYHGIIYTPKFLSYFLGLLGLYYLIPFLIRIIWGLLPF